MTDIYEMPAELVLGRRLNERVPPADQQRQRAEVQHILQRLKSQPGVILADEVGMGKTFVALAVAFSIAMRNPKGPVIIMVPSNLVEKWKTDLRTFGELYLEGCKPVDRDTASAEALSGKGVCRFGVALHSVDLLKLLDDPPRERCHIIFLAQRAMARRQTDKWIRLALIGEALRRHGRGKAARLIQVKKQIPRFVGELIYALGEQRAQAAGTELWERLLQSSPEVWRDIYNSEVRDASKQLKDHPVPKAVSRALNRVDLKALAEALQGMPVRAKGGDERVSERIKAVRNALSKVENDLWKDLLAKAQWRSPLLVMDEAHHLKNAETALARHFKAADIDQDLKTGDATLSKTFDRMLFLTATPFQLGHHELVQVLRRFGDVRPDEAALGPHQNFESAMNELRERLDDSQRAAVAFQRSWSKLQPEDAADDLEAWWAQIGSVPIDSLSNRQKAVVEAYQAAKRTRDAAEKALRPWVVRHNKGTYWAGTSPAIARRTRVDGGAIVNPSTLRGIQVPPDQLLPFFLAARSVVRAGQDLLGEALCSSYEAFRHTRLHRVVEKDRVDDEEQRDDVGADLSHSRWYLQEFDRALESSSGSNHPKMAATVKKVVDLWEAGEKVLVFAFYRRTCRALRIHISQEIERRMRALAAHKLGKSEGETNESDVEKAIESIQSRFADDSKSPGRKALNQAIAGVLAKHGSMLDEKGVTKGQRDQISDVIRRFFRVKTTLVRSFPLGEVASLTPAEAVDLALDHQDQSGSTWRQKFEGFVSFLIECSEEERRQFLDAALRTQTGGIRVEDEEDDEDATVTLANVQVATGVTRRETRSRLMRAFNTPFFPDILVCSEVMGEGVDLQRFCRHVVHHDLAWNPSTIEQRTGRIDRLACKAEGRHSIVVYIPYLGGTADERQYQVMTDRERWFRVVMGQEEVARLISPRANASLLLPESVSNDLAFKLAIDTVGLNRENRSG
ncbi:MAG: helicase-related protein [Vicinamibacterales bacterium]